MAEKRTIDINIKNNADEATKDFNTFNDALDETARSAKNVNSTFEEVYGDLQPLTTRLGEAEDRLYELALAGDTTSKEYQELLTKVGEYRKVQIQTDLAVDGAATTMTQKLGSALNAATSGFAATQGAIALFGEENEALNESLLKVQSALAIQQGVQGLTEAYKELSIGTKLAGAAQAIFSTVVGTTSGALKLFRIALLSTGIGAIVVGLGLLIANFDKVKEAVSGAIDRFKNLGPVMKALLLPITAIVEGAGLVKDALQALGVLESDEEEARKARAEAQRKRIEAEIERETKLFDLRKRNFADEQRAFDRRRALLQAEGKETGVLEQLKELNAIKQAKRDIEYAKGQIQRIRLLKRRLDGQSERAKQFEQQIDAFNQAIKDSNQQILDSNNQLKINVINANKEKADSYRQYVEDKKKADQEALDEEIDAEIELAKTFAEIKRANEDALRTEEENELLRNEEKYDKLEAMAYGNAEALEEIETARLNARNEILLKYDNEAYENKKALDDKAAAEEKERRDKQLEDIKAHQEREQEIRMATVNTAIQGFQLIADFAESFAGDDVKRQKKAFQIKKAADIAAATVDGYRAVLSTYAQTPGGPVLKGIAAGVAGGFAALQIANIARQQFEGEGGSGDFSADTGGGAGEVITPEFNVVGDAGINQLAQLQQQPTQAFVVSGEVTSAQALDRNRVTNATL
jgi:hypothetical protein